MAYPAKLWAKVRTDYETGNYTLAELQKKHKISATQIETRSLRGGWVKGGLLPAIEKSTQEKYLEAFRRVGVDEKKIAGTVKEMMHAEKTVIIPSGQEGQSGFAEVLPDWQARDKAVTQMAKLTGAYAAEKTESKTEIHGDIVVKYEFEDVKNVSDTETPKN